jgi:hydroxypyruvate isomerase
VGRKIKLDPWIEAGAAAAATPAEAAEGADVLCVCVTDKAAVESVLFGPGGAATRKLVIMCAAVRLATLLDWGRCSPPFPKGLRGSASWARGRRFFTPVLGEIALMLPGSRARIDSRGPCSTVQTALRESPVNGALPIAANISTLFRELPLPERFEAARSRGFDGVEIQFPYAESAEVLARAAAAANMPVVLINAPAAAPDFGIAGRPGLKGLFRAQLAQAEEYAEALGARFVHVLAGVLPDEADRARSLSVYEDNLHLAAEKFHPNGVGVLIEPLNPSDVPGYLLGSFDIARSILRRQTPEIGMQFDAYHAARMELDVVDEFKRSLPYVRHVQFADVPGRHEPGTGVVPFTQLLKALRDAEYGGWLSAEYFPSGPTEESLYWLADWRAAMSASLPQLARTR